MHTSNDIIFQWMVPTTNFSLLMSMMYALDAGVNFEFGNLQGPVIKISINLATPDPCSLKVANWLLRPTNFT